MRQLVILRPEPGASASVERARSMGLDAVTIPLFEVRAVEWSADPDAFDAIVATSANAFRHGGAELETLHHLPIHAVGEATAREARAKGFAVASVGRGGAEDMELPSGRIAHLAGRDHVALKGTQALVVYEAVAVEPAPDLTSLAGAVVAVHSPRAGERLAALVRDRGSIAIAAISDAAAAACGTGWEEVAIAGEPRDAALLALAAKLCKNDDR